MDVSQHLKGSTYQKRVNDDYVQKNRKIGELWERNFCDLAGKQFKKSFTAHQIGRDRSAQIITYGNGWNTFTAPDITVWTAPGEHHEIKHKDPTTRFGLPVFGLEEYRLKALVWFANETAQNVMYTIHNYGWQPDETRVLRKKNQNNDLLHWVTQDVKYLFTNQFHKEAGESICNGKSIQTNIIYWPVGWFIPLYSFWDKHISY